MMIEERTRDRTMTEDSVQYRLLMDDQDESIVDLESVSHAGPIEDSMFLHHGNGDSDDAEYVMDSEHALDNDDDDDVELTPFLLFAEPAQLNGLNFLNVVSYAAHIAVSLGIGVWGLDGILDNRVDIILRHETLVTPAVWAYYIWIPILLAETVFAVAQLLPEYRARSVVQDGTGFFFFYTCLLQIVWTICFAFELFILSFVAVILTTLCLASLLTAQSFSTPRGRNKNRMEFWLFRFPFRLHFGWIVVMAAVHLALLVRFESDYTPAHLTGDMMALGLLLPVACYYLIQQTDKNDFVVPAVILWAYVGIAWRLNAPPDELVELYGHDVVRAFNAASYAFGIVVCCLLLPRITVWACRTYCTIRVVQYGHSMDSFR